MYNMCVVIFEEKVEKTGSKRFKPEPGSKEDNPSPGSS